MDPPPHAMTVRTKHPIAACGLNPMSCIGSGDVSAIATVGPGPAYVVVDSAGGTAEGECVIVVEQH